MAWLNHLPEELNSIWSQIESGNFDQALCKLIQYTRDRDWDYYKELLMFKTRYERLEQEKRLEIIEHKEYKREFNKIVNSFLECFKRLSDLYSGLNE